MTVDPRMKRKLERRVKRLKRYYQLQAWKYRLQIAWQRTTLKAKTAAAMLFHAQSSQ